jgi:hypothetical protein
MLGFGKDVTEALITKYQRDYQEERGLRSIVGFLAHGGKAEQVTIGEEQADLFRKRLQEKHVTYYETIITRDDNTKQHMFMYKGVTVHNGKETPTPDKLQVEQIKKMFELELSCNSKEMDVHSFKSLMNGAEVGIADNLSVEQLYAFRQNVKDTDIKFCVLQDKEGKYKIYANDKTKLTNVLVNMSYDLANDTDGIFAHAAVNYAAKRHDFYEKCGTQPYVICDKNNPNNFIYVGKHNYSVHSFQKEDEPQPDGTVKEIIRDKMKPQVLNMDKDALFEQVKQIANPIMVPAEEFTLLENVNKNGLAFARQDVAVNYAEFKEQHKSDDLVIDKYPRKQPRYSEQNLDGYVHLPMSLVQQIKQELPFVKTNDVDSIAFEKQYKPAVDAYLQKNVFDTIEDPMQALSFRWKIEGRTGEFNPQLAGNVTNEFYIINPDNDKLTLHIDSAGAHVHRDGKEAEMCPADSPQYKEFMQQYLDESIIPNPVVLTSSEIQADNAKEVISERANHFHENPVIIEMINFEEIEKLELIENFEHIHEMELSPEQEKAVKGVEKLHIHSKELDSAVFVEMQDLAVNKEISKDTEMDM